MLKNCSNLPVLVIVLVLVVCLGTLVLAQTQDHETIYLLESHPGYSLVLPLSHELDENVTFTIQSPRFHRVMAVLQYVNLPPRNDFTCGSYLQFQDGVEKRSDKICGNFDPDEKSYQPASLVGPRSYLSSRDTLKVSLTQIRGKMQKIYARIAFTAYREDCYYTQRKDSIGGLPRYRPCSYSTSSDGIGTRCIVSTLFCDEVVHCASASSEEGTDFGEDESQVNCPHIYHLKESFAPSTTTGDADGTQSKPEGIHPDPDSGGDGDGGRVFKKFFDEREERLANIFKSAIIGFVGFCTVCVLIAFVITIFCLKQRYDEEH